MDVEHLNINLVDRSARGLARAVAALASTGELVPGERLPPLREVAQGMGMSSSTVGEAWKLLVAQGLLNTRGRRGTFLRQRPGVESVRHFRHIHEAQVSADFSTGYPDPALLIDLRPFVAELATGPPFPGYPEAAVDPDLRDLLGQHLPFCPDGLVLSTDVLLAVSELLPLLTRYGDRVVVGEAEFAPYLDLLERQGLEPIPVPYDDEGPDLAATRRALVDGAALVVLQPRVHNPTGQVTTQARLHELAAAYRDHDAWAVEIDYFGQLASSPPMSATSTAPSQTVHLRSFAKDLHPDLRVCAVTGPASVLDTLHERRGGGTWISRLNQRLLAAVLASPEVTTTVRAHKVAYDGRRRTFLEALKVHGLETSSRDGFNVWVPVRSEESALVYLASRGVGAAPGSPFQAANGGTPHIRVSIARMREDHDRLARLVAEAARVRRPSTQRFR